MLMRLFGTAFISSFHHIPYLRLSVVIYVLPPLRSYRTKNLKLEIIETYFPKSRQGPNLGRSLILKITPVPYVQDMIFLSI